MSQYANYGMNGRSLFEDFDEEEIENSTQPQTPVPVINTETVVERIVVPPTAAAAVAIDLRVAIVSSRFEIPALCLENCPICFEEIVGVNMSITTCGHAFHCFCLLAAVERNDECPLCRHTLVNTTDDDDDDDDDSETLDDSSNESTSTDDEASNVTLEQLSNKLTNLGYTMIDLLYMLTPISSVNPRHNDAFCESTYDMIDNIKNGRVPLSQRDTRSYSQVVGIAPEPVIEQEL